MNNLQSLLEDVCAEIKAKQNGHIDFRTTIGRTTKAFIDRVANPYAVKDPATKIVKKAAEQNPAKETPEEIKEEVVRRVLDGEVVKSVDSKTQKREANKNSSLSKAERRRIALKSAKTRRKDKSGEREAVEKRAKANAKRDLLNL